MELAKLEQAKQMAIQEVIMQEKMVEQAKAKVANIDGRIAERKEILAEAKPVKKKVGKEIQKAVAERIGKQPRNKK